MDESRQRFVESAEMLLHGLETGYCEYQGQFVKQPRAAIRPAPFKSFRGRTYAAAVSPDSLPIMARLGIGILDRKSTRLNSSHVSISYAVFCLKKKKKKKNKK